MKAEKLSCSSPNFAEFRADPHVPVMTSELTLIDHNSPLLSFSQFNEYKKIP